MAYNFSHFSSTCQKLCKFMKIWQSSDRKNFAQIFLRHGVYTGLVYGFKRSCLPLCCCLCFCLSVWLPVYMPLSGFSLIARSLSLSLLIHRPQYLYANVNVNLWNFQEPHKTSAVKLIRRLVLYQIKSVRAGLFGRESDEQVRIRAEVKVEDTRRCYGGKVWVWLMG